MSDLLLAGGGHAHLFVLEALARAGGRHRVTLVSARRMHAYSGMLPGVTGLRYAAAEASVDLAALAAGCGVRFVEGEVAAFDAATRTVTLADGRTEAARLVSLAVGSSVAGLERPGVQAHAQLVKPIDRAAAIGPALDAAAARGGLVPVVVVGGGAAGCELAWAARARLLARGAVPEVTIVERGVVLVADRGPGLQARAAAACTRLGVRVLTGVSVAEVTADAVRLDDGRQLPAAACLWVAGSRAAPWLATSGLACDARGYVQVDAQLRAVSHPEVFAAGDTATPVAWPETPKAGVYAVRAGPILAANLLAALDGRPATVAWTPQRDFLALLNTGDGRAIGAFRGRTFEGAWAMRLKDLIDRRFLRRFATLAR